MAKVNHINIVDENGNVYCRLRNLVVEFDEYHQENFCSNCPMFAGTAQGEGVECEWEDDRPNIENPYMVTNAFLEYQNIVTHEAKKQLENEE